MKIAMTGASGFVGAHLTQALERQGHDIRPVDLRKGVETADLEGCETVVNLAGEPVAQRWTDQARERIRGSRVDGTRALVRAMAGLSRPAQLLISASAVGCYGSRGDEILTEDSTLADDFLGRVASDWEREAHRAEDLGTRVAIMRFGVVLGPHGGALKKMLAPFRLGMGGRLGSGEQWMSWIHLDDLIAMISFLMVESTVRGVFNATAPHPVTNAVFTHELAHAVHRPAIVPVPGFALKILLGEMASVLLNSQRVVPQAAVRAGFEFRYPEIGAALVDVLK